MIDVKLLSGALGAEISGINLKDSSKENCNKINNLLLEHKVLFFRNQNISSEEQIAIANCFGSLEKHIYVKGREKYPEIVRIIKGPNEKHQWGETWHTDVSYNVKPTKVIILRSVKIPPVGGDTMFSNMEIADETLEEEIKDDTGVDVKLPIDIKGSEVLMVSPSADFFAEPHIDGLIGYAKVFHESGVSWTLSSYASEARTVMSNVHNAAKMYYQTKGEWPGDVEQLERAGQLDLDRSTKLKWTFELQLPDRLSATSTEEMQGGAGKVVSFDALTGKFQGYGSPEESQ